MLRSLRLSLLLGTCALLMGASIVSAQEGENAEPSPVQAVSADLMKVNILFVGAHPDDDSVATSTLARYAFDHGATTGVITATHGEGGGNAIGRELGPALGMVREAEERAALSQLGVRHVYYLNEQDWAFTTSASATENFWGYEEPLGNLVRMFRVLRPDVVITMNPSAGSGHGHHQYAAKLATEAFFLAGDPTAFPEQLNEEFLEPWQPKKLYYGLGYGGFGLQASLEFPSNEYSRTRFMTYADMEASALRLYRSQGFDTFFTVPAPSWALGPEVFMLAASVLPIGQTETDLLAGVNTGIDNAPAGVELVVDAENFYMSQGSEQQVTVTFRNYSTMDLSDVILSLSAPEGWTVSDPVQTEDAPVGQQVSADFTVTVPADADTSAMLSLMGGFQANDAAGVPYGASKPELVSVTPPVTMQLQPIQAVQIYRDWAERIGMEHIVGLAQTEITVGVGETGAVPVVLNNRSDADQEVTVTLAVEGSDVSLDAQETTITVPAGQTLALNFNATIAAGGTQNSFPMSATMTYGDYNLTDTGTLQVVPVAEVAQVETAPTIDGDLAEFAALPQLSIANTNIWEGETTDAADLTGTFALAYDDQFLYVAVDVNDETVVSNIAPNDIKGHWRSDSVEITIDPQGPGVSENTLTTFKTGIFPFDTEGTVQAERDADANQGPISLTAPNMQVASTRTDDGYTLEVAIPWESVPGEIQPGSSFGFNVLIYDCDNANAATGENCNEARTAWSYWNEIQGNPRLWGHAVLADGE